MAITETGEFEIIVDASCQTSISGREGPGLRFNIRDNRYVQVYPRITGDVNNAFAKSSWFVQVFRGKDTTDPGKHNKAR